ncbi:hypothetical protein D9619_013601 [Psilocybe cf. subviscida]|uniref:Fe2OG dioxygenase domain-containing protein n=1 Tax=Psilocybe cf. subviscida TaxID=2480587 RepID=A0A8H5ARP3_9AGAR|nr:hypothetical protein D9619_013601 [Psilocybe cf. subviscida]
MAPTAGFEALRKAFCLIEDHVYCSGVVPLEGNCSSLIYRTKNSSSGFIDFLNTDDNQLAALSDACEPASFGRDHEDVLDEEYRKAGKMDSSNFSAQFSIYTSGILDTVVSSLLKENHQANDIRAELYKLNVYGPGSFFKPHVDTPRSDAMFGSLVIVFPTKHEGGSLKFRQGDQQWSFDSSDLVASEPRVAFTAFFSDVEHEVLPVTSGYRVTLTYSYGPVLETTFLKCLYCGYTMYFFAVKSS